MNEQDLTNAPTLRWWRTENVLTEWLLPSWFLVCALLYALTTLCAILNFALRQPMFDQYKEYGNYLSQPFVAAVLMVENGHHPVFPALIANLEILWFKGDQCLQLVIGTSCAFLVAATIAGIAWRQTSLPRVARAAGVMLAILGVLWLANARMLLQGVGQLQIYLVALAVVLSMLCTWHAARLDSWTWIACACVACFIAMFTFGAGVAGFPTIIMLGVLLRMRWQKLLMPGFIGALCIILYVFVLPGHQGVDNSLAFRPLDGLIAAAKWLSSPWVNGFLGIADPPVQPWLPGGLNDPMGRLLQRTANGLIAVVGVPWSSIATIIGLAGILTFSIRAAIRYLRRAPIDRYETLASGLCIFGLTTAAIIGIGRVDYFQTYPEQVFADRYLAWPSLFWMGLTLLLLSDAYRSQRRSFIAAGLLFLTLLPVVLLPTQRVWAGWSASVYEIAQRSAAAARSGVADDKVFPIGAEASRDDVVHTLSLLRQHHLAMFADLGWQLMGTSWTTVDGVGEMATSSASIVSTFPDAVTGLLAARVTGTVTRGIALLARSNQLAVLDADDRIVGLAEFSFITSDAYALRLDLPLRRGFDGYIRDYDPKRSYRLVLLQTREKRATFLQSLAPSP